MRNRTCQIIKGLFLLTMLLCVTAGTTMAQDSVAVHEVNKYLISAFLVGISIIAGILAGMYVRRKTR